MGVLNTGTAFEADHTLLSSTGPECVKLYLYVILRRHDAVTHFLVSRNSGDNQLRQRYATGWGVWGVGRVVGFLANSVPVKRYRAEVRSATECLAFF